MGSEVRGGLAEARRPQAQYPLRMTEHGVVRTYVCNSHP